METTEANLVQKSRQSQQELTLNELFGKHFEYYSQIYLQTFQTNNNELLAPNPELVSATANEEPTNEENLQQQQIVPEERSLVGWGPRPQMMNLETRLFQEDF